MCFRKFQIHSSIAHRISLLTCLLFISLTPAAHAALPVDPPPASAPARAEGVLDEIQIAGSSLKARGWVGAGDSANPVAGISIVFDGVEIYRGGFEKQPRPDVAQAKGRSDWLESGFLIQAPINAPLPEGPRKFTATALLKNGDRFELRVSKESLTVGPAMPATPPANPPQLLGQLDESVLEGNQLRVRGWVASADTAKKIKTILLKSGEETLYRGEFQIEQRPDVATALGKPDLVNSGWIVRLDWSGKPLPTNPAVQFEMQTGEILALPIPVSTSKAKDTSSHEFQLSLPEKPEIELKGCLDFINIHKDTITCGGWFGVSDKKGNDLKSIIIRDNMGLEILLKNVKKTERPDVAQVFNSSEWINSGWLADGSSQYLKISKIEDIEVYALLQNNIEFKLQRSHAQAFKKHNEKWLTATNFIFFIILPVFLILIKLYVKR
jgi:hypothetical protein